jgi:peptidyl-prolyl cis-trans isomerase D
MMKQMRENTKIILWIVVVAFVVTIFAVWGLDLQTGQGPVAGQYNILGKVNGVSITRNQYQAAYEQLAAQMRAASTSNQLTYAQQEMIQDQAWDNIVSSILTEQQIEKLGIGVTDDEIVAFLRTSPPPEIQQYFVDESGNFDMQAYLSALNNPEADWTAVEALARQRIPMIKLNRYLMSQVHVSAMEVRRQFEENNVIITAKYVSFPVADEDISDYAPSDEEIQTYYDEHPDEFRAGERAAVEYVKIPIEPTDRDLRDIMFDVTQHSKGIAGGEDFAETARDFSQAPTASVGGETGFITAAQRDEKVMSQVAIMNPGQVSQPIQTDNGVYLVKLLETKTEDGETRYNIQEIFVELAPGRDTVDSLLALARKVQKDAAGTGLPEAAAGLGLTVNTTDPFQRNFPIAGIGFVPSVNRFAFSNEVGALSNVIGDENNYYICRVSQRFPEEVQPLDDVRPRIESTLKYERQKRMALRKAEGFHRRLTTTPAGVEPGGFDQAAEDYALVVHQPAPFRVADPVEDMPPFSPFAYATLDLLDDNFSPPVESRGIYYVIQVIGRSEIDEEAFVNNAPGIHDRLQQEKVQAYVTYWYEKLKDNAEIEDNRGQS